MSIRQNSWNSHSYRVLDRIPRVIQHLCLVGDIELAISFRMLYMIYLFQKRNMNTTVGQHNYFTTRVTVLYEP